MSKRKTPRVKSLKSLKGLGGFPTNPGPYSKYFTTPKGDRVEFSDWQKIFDDYDDTAIKPGYPYVSIYGKQFEVVGKCAFCQNPILASGRVVFCFVCKKKLVDRNKSNESPDTVFPYGRRRRYNEAPDSEYPSETSGQELAYNTPLPSETQFDANNYPQQAPGTSRSDTY